MPSPQGNPAFPVNGQITRSSMYMLDGVNHQATFFSNITLNPIIGTIEEFKVQSHKSRAEKILSRAPEISIKYSHPGNPEGIHLLRDARQGAIRSGFFLAHDKPMLYVVEDVMTRRTATARESGTLDVYSIDRDALLVGRLKGVFDIKLAEQIVQFVEAKESTTETGFNRFCDMSQLERIDLSSEDILHLAARRRAFNPNDTRVKSAFFAPDPLAFGIARMYEQMLNSPRIEVRVWCDMQAAADWLGIRLDRLTL